MIIIVVAVVINSPLVLTKSVRSCGSLKAVKAADKCLLSYPPYGCNAQVSKYFWPRRIAPGVSTW